MFSIFIASLLFLMGCQEATFPSQEVELDSLRQELIRRIKEQYAYDVDLEKLNTLSIDEILAALDQDSVLKKVEPPSLDFIRGFQQEGSVSEPEVMANDIGYLKIGFFGRRTVSDFTKAVSRLSQQKLRGLILDLRDNPGGSLENAIRLAELFLLRGTPLAIYSGRGDHQIWQVSRDGGIRDEPVVVLINRGTASSAELFAGLLQYYRRALLVGTRSAGKSTVQSAIPLDHQHLLVLTTGWYTFPDGSSVRATGITPDYEIVRADEQLTTALSILAQGSPKP